MKKIDAKRLKESGTVEEPNIKNNRNPYHSILDIPDSQPPNSSKIGNKIVYTALVIIGLAVALFVYWTVQPTDVLTFKNSPTPTRTVSQNGDQAVILSVDYCKNIAVDGVVRTSFISSTREILQPVAPEDGPKTCKKLDLPILIPKDIIPDTYRVKFVVTYTINPLKQNVNKEFLSAPFEVK